jgi:hypothetical protein
MTDLEIQPFTWFSEREVRFKPKHFVITKTPITSESRKWIYDKLKGRFAVINIEAPIGNFDDFIVSDTSNQFPSFEDPAEATFYELTWS